MIILYNPLASAGGFFVCAEIAERVHDVAK
jgi:hypothetical protein